MCCVLNSIKVLVIRLRHFRGSRIEYCGELVPGRFASPSSLIRKKGEESHSLSWPKSISRTRTVLEEDDDEDDGDPIIIRR